MREIVVKILINSSLFTLAPPISTPSISFLAMKLLVFPELTEPPYRKVLSIPYLVLSVSFITEIDSTADSGVSG